MSEKPKEQTTKEFLKDLNEGDFANIWEMDTYLQSKNPEDRADFLKIFNEEQLELIGIIVNQVVKAMKWHDEYDEAHADLRKEVNNVDAKLRNHRHDTTKQYSAKAEF